MKSIDIVTHCWSGPDVPIYHELLRLQLNSLVSDPPEDLRVGVWVCYSPEDERTCSVLAEVAALNATEKLGLRPLPLDEPDLFRRAIGRNRAALGTRADVVWFTDCDHLFTARCLRAAVDAAEKINPEGYRKMIHPQVVRIHATHALGDDLIRHAELISWGGMDLSEGSGLSGAFAPRTEKKAIGGLQIVPGYWARGRGYLDGTRWTEPVRADHFQQCRCDVPYRKSCGGSRAVEIPGLFRVRHSRAGRDRGEKDHGEQTRI